MRSSVGLLAIMPIFQALHAKRCHITEPALGSVKRDKFVWGNTPGAKLFILRLQIDQSLFTRVFSFNP